MVCLNEFIPFNKINLRNDLITEMESFMQVELENYIEKNLLEKLTKQLKTKITRMFNNDYFIYKHMGDRYCTHKFKRGKNEGRFCCRKIGTYLHNDKKDFLCVQHSKLHIPRKERQTR